MGQVIDFTAIKENLTEHIVHEAMCVSCLHRWIEVRPQGTLLKNLECPNCGKVGYVISTGQEIKDEVEV